MLILFLDCKPGLADEDGKKQDLLWPHPYSGRGSAYRVDRILYTVLILSQLCDLAGCLSCLYRSLHFELHVIHGSALS